MAFKLDIPDSQLPKFKEMYTTMAKDILSRMEGVQKEWEEIQPVLHQLEIHLINEPKKSRLRPKEPLIAELDLLLGYNKEWSWAKRAAYVIKTEGRPLLAKEILDIIIQKHDPSLDRSKATNSLPATLSVEAKEGRFERASKNGEYLYDFK